MFCIIADGLNYGEQILWLKKGFQTFTLVNLVLYNTLLLWCCCHPKTLHQNPEEAPPGGARTRTELRADEAREALSKSGVSGCDVRSTLERC